MKKYYIILIVVLFLSSCDWAGNYYFSVDNKSSYPVTVGLDPEYKYQYNKTSDSLIIVNPGKKVVFWSDHGFNNGDRGNDFLVLFDTIYIKPNDSTVRLIKDFKLKANWEIKTHDYGFRGNNSDYYYNFIITDNDIEKIK